MATVDANEKPPWEYNLRKYLTLLAMQVATVTYTAGFTPPGGVWQDTAGGHLAGDPILRQTSCARFVAFYYLNATAFVSSLVAIVLILVLSTGEMKSKSLAPVRVLRGFMLLDLLSLIGAYAAGTYLDRDVPVHTMVAVALTVADVVVFHMVLPWRKKMKKQQQHGTSQQLDDGKTTHGKPRERVRKLGHAATSLYRLKNNKPREKLENERKVLMVLATFAVSVTYLAGLCVPGGFWNHADGNHFPGEPLLMVEGGQKARFKSFVYFNSTAFFCSLLIVVQLLDKDLRMDEKVRYNLLYTTIILALLGLVGAYSAGSSRDMGTTINGTLLVGALLVCVILAVQVLRSTKRNNGDSGHPSNDATPRVEKKKESTLQQTKHSDIQSEGGKDNSKNDEEANLTSGENNIKDTIQQQTNDSNIRQEGEKDNSKDDEEANLTSGEKNIEDTTQQQTNDSVNNQQKVPKKARSLVVLLATLAATITYQAGLDPPGGIWESDGVGHQAGDPILLTKNPRRYKVFFYCNSIAFVASLVAIILVKSNKLLQNHALEAAMVLDLFGLIGAYAAGSCRDVNTSIYAMALAGVVLVYVVIHVLFFTLDHDTSGKNDEEKKALEVMEKKRKRLLLFAILVATITYQAGLTPPGGFRTQDDVLGHQAGDPTLLFNFPRRYKAFFYCNSVSFMLSIALILLLVNPNLYRPAIKSHAVSVCTAAGMFSLVGAYAAGSTQYLKTSIKIFGLVAAILVVVVAFVLGFFMGSNIGGDANNQKSTPDKKGKDRKETDEEKTGPLEQVESEEKKLHSKRKYLMLLGILGASVTYQAGLKPPGGVWQANSLGHVAGNPVMHDNGRNWFLAFFYINSTSFMASVVVIILLLLESLQMDNLWSMKAMNTTIVLDLLGLLVAYAVGSNRSWKTTG
ncbi:hypothetical protein EJB05_34410, partial [Eragrostis curvula]